MRHRNLEIRMMQLEEVIHRAEVFLPVAKDAVHTLGDDCYGFVCREPLYSIARKQAQQLFRLLQAFLDDYRRDRDDH